MQRLKQKNKRKITKILKNTCNFKGWFLKLRKKQKNKLVEKKRTQTLQSKKSFSQKIKADSLNNISTKIPAEFYVKQTLEEYFELTYTDKKSLGKTYLWNLFLGKLFSLNKKILKRACKLGVKFFYRSIAIGVIIAISYGAFPSVLSAPKSKTIATKAQWEAGTFSGISAGSVNNTIQLKASGTWTARTWAPTPDNISFGSTSVMADNYLFVVRGYGDKSFYRYDTQKNKWDSVKDLPQAAHYGCDGVFDGDDSIYFIFGGFSREFYKYSIKDNSWMHLPDLLDTVYQGAGIEFDGTDVYIVRGGNSTDFWKFDVSENSWFNLAPTPASVYRGGNIVYGQNGHMYMLRGYNRNNFYAYDITNNSWSTKASAPATFYGEEKGVYHNGYIYFLRSNNTTSFYRYNISGNSWDTLDGSPENNNYSSLTYNSNDGYIYALRGNGQYHLWKFDPEAGTTGKWVGPKRTPGTINNGGDLIWNGIEGAGAYLYAPRGGSNAFYRYDITNNDWSTLANAPGSLSYDTKGTYYNGYIYIPQGGNNTNFYRYDVAGDSWTTLAPAPGNLRYGSSAAYNASDGYIYVTRGNYSHTFYRYNITGDSWETLSNITVIGGADYRVSVGGRLESDGTNLYLMPGYGETAFLKYDVSSDSWSELARTPFAQYHGTDMTYYNGNIYALAGIYKNETWSYNIASNHWQRLPDNQKYTFDRGPYNGASITYAGNNSFYATPGFGLTDVWSFSLGTHNFLTTGTYISQSMDMSYVASWIGLTDNSTTPTGTNINYETRTSDDNVNWSSWESVTNGNISSPTKRYIQVKAILTSDGSVTPTINSITISYNSEEVEPVNPTNLTAKSTKISGTDLTSGTAYAYTHPYFSWEGGSDNGSGIDGYYVYFGNNSGADPEAEGIYQTTSEYVVNLAMETGNYYLKIKAKDRDGNVSNTTWDAFTYNYIGVSPSLNKTVTSQADFEKGTVENVSTSNNVNALQLESVNGFWNQSQMSYLPAGVRYGAELTYVEADGALYTLRGNNTKNFYRYDIATNTWTTLANTPDNIYRGGYLTNGPTGYLYATRGDNTAIFYRYDIANDLWETMSNAPKNFYNGSSLNYDGERYIYASPGRDDAFYRYDTQTGYWTTLSNIDFGNPNEGDGQKTYVGSDSVFDGINSIYMLQGNYYPYFSKYTINNNQEQGETADTWTALAKAPAGIYAGGSLAYDATNKSIYMLSGNWRQSFYKYDIASDSWTQLPNIPAHVGYGASLQVVGNYIYALRGENSTSFYRFNIENNSWEKPQQGFFGKTTTYGSSYFGFYYGTEMAEDKNGNIYITRGSLDNAFGKYNIASGEFTRLSNTPIGIYNGSAMVFDENENVLYLTSGDISTRNTNGTNNYFMKYDVGTDTWSIITSDPIPSQTSYGSDMIYDGSRYIYLTRGSNSNYWWRYDTQAVAGSRWSARLATISGWTEGYGGNIVYKDNYIYATRGQNTNTFWRYDVATDSWIKLADVPHNIYAGGSLSDGEDGYLYAICGYNTKYYYRYNITSNVWESITDVPGKVYRGGAGVYSNQRIWVTAGNGSQSYRDGLYDYVIGSTSQGVGFEKTGNYISEAIDLTAVYRWANLSLTYTKPDNTSLSVYTRSSEDSSDWSTWDQATEEKNLGSHQYRYSINSPPNQYIQVKLVLTSADQIFSPIVSDFAINYYQDITPPTNPSAVNAYSDNTKVTTLTTNSWYNNVSPYFEWPVADTAGGAVDNTGGSGIAGYYVYFGTDANADPVDFQAENNYTASALTSGNTYYLKIQAVDKAGMIAADTYQAFIYKFDSTAPNNPSDITVSPTGYSSAASFDFTWTADASDSSSGVDKFQYKTGDTADTWHDIVDSNTVSQAAVPYQANKNTFYLRTIDKAGNISEPISMNYFWSGGAASPPTNLVVTPNAEDNVTNQFTFSWDLPESYAGDPNKITYYYSVNYLPTPFNTVETTARAAGPGPFATQYGKNTFYIVAMNEGGSKTNPTDVDWDHPTKVDFYAKTTAPSPPVNAQVFDTSDREAKEYSVAIKWSEPTSFDKGNFAGYTIYRSLDNKNFIEVATTTGSAYVDTGLESRLYYYYVRARDKTNNLSIPTSTLSLTPTGRYLTPPNIVTQPAVSVQSFAATITWSTNRVASSFVEYGTGVSLGKTNGQVDSVTSHSVKIAGLSAATKYYYRVKFIDPDGNIGTSEIGNFTTNDPPTISSVVVDNIGLDSANISWKTNMSGTCKLQYGESSLTSSIDETSGGTTHIQKVANLKSSTQYQYQVECLDVNLNLFKSDQYSFTTLEQPKVTDFTVENKKDVDIPTIEVAYTTTHKTTTLVKFKGNNESNYHNYLISDYATEHKATIKGLDPAIKYEVVATGIDENGIEAASISKEVTTLTDSRPPGITTNRAAGKVIGLGKNSRANLYVKIETDELTTVKVLFGKGTLVSNFDQSTSVDPANTYHLITIPVDPGQVYTYIVEATDMANNKTTTKPVTVVVEGAKENATEIVLNTFSDKFGWISQLWKK